MGTKVLDAGGLVATVSSLCSGSGVCSAPGQVMGKLLMVSGVEWVSSDSNANHLRLQGRSHVHRPSIPSKTLVGPQLISSFYNPTVGKLSLT